MPSSLTLSSRKIGVSCAAALFLFTAHAGAQVFTTSESLQNTSSTPYINVPDFDSLGETLIDVTFTLELGGNAITIFDAQNPGNALINVSYMTPGQGTGWISGANFITSDIDPGTLDIKYTEITSNASNYGAAAQFLFGTKANQGSKYVDVNFDYIDDVNNNGGGDGNPLGGGGNPLGGGGSPDVPEPSATYLSLLAASAMAVLLVGRNVRRRAQS